MGRILISKTLENGKIVSDLILAPSFVGSEVIQRLDSYQATVTAFDSCAIQVLGKESLDERMQNHPEFTRSLLEVESERNLRLRRLANSQRVGVHAAVARVVLDITRPPQYLMYRVPHAIIGQIAGPTRETTSLIMKEFEDRGLIVSDGNLRRMVLKPDLLELVSRIGIPSSGKQMPSHMDLLS